ncbi:hypothetical protein [Hymenobacter metallilatus]|uniref:Type I restriction enzyme R protein N-terminal domain-containing protein n=1 Tax=Hymenobacter metallilatus TaxID=2493666 RepID=A0A428JDB2_9BACT|nr:hypothetical protein [Hymenobacter metallilatus]RSK30087.1 hypothetical protein EI290_14615 [Hymenobacter metallilatus]
MTISSPLASLYSVLQTVRASAQTNATLLRKNEAATRAALIDPVLRALGWDTANVRMVEPERTVGAKQTLDYVLHGAAGEIVAVIEAKKLEESLDKLGHIGAAIGYGFSLKPKQLFITDGLQWHLYSPQHSSYHPAATLNINETPLAEAALQLIQWLDAAHSGYGIGNQAVLVAESSKVAIDTVSAKKSITKSDKVTKDSPDKFVELTHVNTLQLDPTQKPRQLRLPDGSVVPLKTWKDILEKSCEFVLQHNLAIPLPYPDKAGRKRFLFTADKPLVGSSTPIKYLHKSIFIYTHYSATDCIANALHALKLTPDFMQKVVPSVAF